MCERAQKKAYCKPCVRELKRKAYCKSCVRELKRKAYCKSCMRELKIKAYCKPCLRELKRKAYCKSCLREIKRKAYCKPCLWELKRKAYCKPCLRELKRKHTVKMMQKYDVLGNIYVWYHVLIQIPWTLFEMACASNKGLEQPGNLPRLNECMKVDCLLSCPVPAQKVLRLDSTEPSQCSSFRHMFWSRYI